MGIPQVIMIVLYSLNIIISVLNNGEPAKHCWKESTCAVILCSFLLWWGGFWS